MWKAELLRVGRGFGGGGVQSQFVAGFQPLHRRADMLQVRCLANNKLDMTDA